MYTLGPAHPEILAGSSPRGGAEEPGSSSGSSRELGPLPRGLTGCAGFVHPSHPTRLNKRTFPHLWAW